MQETNEVRRVGVATVLARTIYPDPEKGGDPELEVRIGMKNKAWAVLTGEEATEMWQLVDENPRICQLIGLIAFMTASLEIPKESTI